jgi:hypothetical protein
VATPADRPFADFKAEVLGQAHEDLMGVYEAWWTANAWYPDRPLSERLAMAERAVAELAAEGRIIVCRGTWEDAEESPVPPEERAAVLLDWATWAIPEGPRVFFIAPDD